MEVKIEIMNAAEAEIAFRAVVDIAELREWEQTGATSSAQFVGNNAPAQPDDEFNRTADTIEERDFVAAAIKARDERAAKIFPAPAKIDVVAALQNALSRRVTAPAVVTFLGKHNVKRVTELPAELHPMFIDFLDQELREVAG